MANISAEEIFYSFHNGNERNINASKRLYHKATGLTSRGASFDLKELSNALRPACALLAKVEWDAVDEERAQRYSCLKRKDWKEALHLVRSALAQQERQRLDANATTVDQLVSQNEFSANILLSCKEIQSKVAEKQAFASFDFQPNFARLSVCAVFCWVAACAQLATEDLMSELARHHHIDLELLRRMCQILEARFSEEKLSIIANEEASRSSPRKAKTSPTKRLPPSQQSPATEPDNRVASGSSKSSGPLKRSSSVLDFQATPSKRLRSELNDVSSPLRTFVNQGSYTPDISPRRVPLRAEITEDAAVTRERTSGIPEAWTSPRKKRPELTQRRDTSDMQGTNSDVPRCGRRRTLFLDREPWHELCNMMDACFRDQPAIQTSRKGRTPLQRRKR